MKVIIDESKKAEVIRTYQGLNELLSDERNSPRYFLDRKSIVTLYEHLGVPEVVRLVDIQRAAWPEYQSFAPSSVISMKGRVVLKGVLDPLKTDPID